jgi:hypothetical protein
VNHQKLDLYFYFLLLENFVFMKKSWLHNVYIGSVLQMCIFTSFIVPVFYVFIYQHTDHREIHHAPRIQATEAIVKNTSQRKLA